jgi:plasmid replication initiation protein
MLDLSKCTVTKSNALIRASYRLTLAEQRVILACLAQVDSRKKMQNLNTLELQTEGLTINAMDYAKLFDLEPHTAYEQLQDAATRLYNRSVTIKKNDRGEKERYRWLQGEARSDKGSGHIRLSFTMRLSEHITQLRGKFTSYQLEQVRHLRKPNAIRIFELMMQWKETKLVRIKLDELREMLEMKYPVYADAKRYVLAPAFDEIDKRTEYAVEWREIRVGRKVETIEIRFEQRPQASLPLED